jgi:protein O-mannosyl-transferase
LSFGFVEWDDPIHVTRNPAVFAPDKASLRDKLTTPALGYPIPITVASYRIEFRVFGPAPWHFHLGNVIAHLVSCALVAWLALRVGLTLAGTLCALLLFGLHPIVAEPVSWVTGRKDVLATCFGLAAVLFAWPPASLRRKLAAVGCYAIGLFAKPTIAPICVLIAIADAAFRVEREPKLDEGRLSERLKFQMRSGLSVLWPYFAALVPAMILGVLGQRAAGAISDPDRAGASFARATWYALGHHLRLLVGLEEPTAKYLPLPWPPPFTPTVDLMPLLAAAVCALVMGRLPPIQRRVFGFGVAWAVLTYLPNSNLIPLVRYLADSYVYLPLIGAALCAGAVMDALVEAVAARASRIVPVLRYSVPIAIALLCVPPLLRSQARWVSDEALWGHALNRYPYNPRVCRMWANGVAKRNGPEPGLQATDRCVSIFGDELFAKNKGVLLGELGRFDEARQWLERARRRHPSDASVRDALAKLPPAVASGSH